MRFSHSGPTTYSAASTKVITSHLRYSIPAHAELPSKRHIASSIQYSGTCGAAFEAANQGCHTIAFSEYHEGTHEVTGKYIEEIASVLIDKPLGKNEIWNINFPGCTLEECRGVKYDCSVSQDQFFSGGYNVVKKDGSKITYMIDYVPSWDAEEGTDLRAVIDNYVAVGKVRNYS